MNRKRTTYQHGNLPAALAEAVIELVGERGVRGFSLAEAARRSGVSNSAPYRHFADRDALLAAVATQAYAEFGALIAAAKRKHRSPRLQLQAMVHAYVSYANRDRARFELLFNSGLDKRRYPELERAGDKALGTLVDTVAALVPGPPECVAGAALVLLHRRGRITRIREELTVAVLLALVVVLPVMQTIRMLWVEPTLSQNVGILELVTEKFPVLMHSTTPPDPGKDAQLRAMSREVFARGLLKRDLALTGSRLSAPGATLPGDLYFYAPASDSSPAPNYGERGVALRARPDMLFDAMMGSGAIYPVFPARTLRDFPVPGESADIVDGSFSHRSPVEAAVLWGATHIVVLEASPEEISPRGSFAANVGAALTHLYDQAQLLDEHSKQHVTTLTLYPSPPHIGLLDFSGDLIAASIARGYRETLGRGALGGAPFHKEPGEPRFLKLER